jgi:hypothetical protein
MRALGQASILGVSPAILLVASVLPQVEAPLPDRIGLGFPFSMAGACGVLVGLAHTVSPPAKRDKAIRMGGLIGFLLGAVFYLLALLAQLTSQL